MPSDISKPKQRQRAPSKRSLQTHDRILDAAERVFASRGFDAATIREIATQADTPVGLVHHHGKGKTELFNQTVTRRAQELSGLRLTALTAAQQQAPLTLHLVLDCFIAPYLDRANTGGTQWLAYARLVAIVSADQRWHDLATRCFDPTARRFIDEIAALYPNTSRQTIASGFVFTVSAMLALLTSHWRIQALGGSETDTAMDVETLIQFCAAGIHAIAT